MKKVLKVVIAILIFGALVAGAIHLVKLRRAQEAKMPTPKEYAVVIDTIKPKAKDITLSLPAMALSKNDNDIILASKISARVLELPKSGSSVKKGEVIIRLDDTEILASLESTKQSIKATKAQLEASSTNLANLELIHSHSAELLKVNGVSKEQFQAEIVKINNAKAQIANLKAQIIKLEAKAKSLENQLTYTRIKSPIDGVVSVTLSSVGDLANPGKPLVKISALNGTWLLVRLPIDAKKIIFGSKEYKLKPLYSTFNGLNEYRADIDRYIPAGNRVKVDVVNYQGKAILLPFDTLLNRDGKDWLFIYKNGKAKPVVAPILAIGEQGVAVSDSLEDREIVEAKPDILLRLLGGYPIVKAPRE